MVHSVKKRHFVTHHSSYSDRHDAMLLTSISYETTGMYEIQAFSSFRACFRARSTDVMYTVVY